MKKFNEKYHTSSDEEPRQIPITADSDDEDFSMPSKKPRNKKENSKQWSAAKRPKNKRRIQLPTENATSDEEVLSEKDSNQPSANQRPSTMAVMIKIPHLIIACEEKDDNQPYINDVTTEQARNSEGNR